MDFALDETQSQMRDALRRYLDSEVAPLVDRYEADGEPVPRAIVARMREYGLLGGMLEPEQGGFGLDVTSYGTLIAEVARVWPSLRSVLSTSNLAASVIAGAGDADLCARYLEPILSGDAIAAFALTEPNVGSDAANVETRAQSTPDGWRLRGRKIYISNGPICDLGVVFARDDSPQAGNRVSCFLFERGMPGFSSSSLAKMGMHSCPLGELAFDDVPIGRSQRIGAPGKGFGIAKKYLNIGRAIVAFSALGISQAACDAAVRYAKDRVQFGQPIGSFQLVQKLIADMLCELESSRLLCYRAAHALDHHEADGALWCSMAKRQATDAVLRICEMSLQVHGGAGYTSLFPVERYYRDARHLSIAEGTNQIQTLLIAQQVLGLSALRGASARS